MTTLGGQIRRKVFGVSIADTTFERRKFRGGDDEAKRLRLETVGATFLEGYHAALEDPAPDAIAARIEAAVPLDRRGFAFEGAGMAVAIADAVSLSGGHVQRFLDGAGGAHVYMAWIGVGWAIARLGGWKRRLARIEPRMRGLAVDGLGFHMGYFKTTEYVDERAAPSSLPPDMVKAFDQGLGRSMWFVEGAGAERVIARVATFPAERRGDLWAGLGLACTYAGGATRAELERVRDGAAAHAADFAQGCAFALSARQRAGNPAEHTNLALELIWRRPPTEVTALSFAAGEDLPPEGGSEPPYEVWRTRIKDAFTKENR